MVHSAHGVSFLLIVIPDVVNEVDYNSRFGDHHRRFGAFGFNHAVTVEILESMLLKQLIRFVKVIHVHADGGHVVRKLDVRRRDVQIEAVRVFMRMPSTLSSPIPVGLWCFSKPSV